MQSVDSQLADGAVFNSKNNAIYLLNFSTLLIDEDHSVYVDSPFLEYL